MFLKPFKLKSNVLLKGSESKRLRQRILQNFPNIDEINLQLLVPNKSAVSMLKLTTHGNFQSSVFCVDKKPLFFEIEGGFFAPTLYAMWSVPDLLPYFTTHPDVLPKLSNGADLMLPGVIPLGKGLGRYGNYKKGQLVAVNLTSNKSAVGVGSLARSSDDLYMSGGHGPCVKILHIFGDKLWGAEASVTTQVPNNSVRTGFVDEDFPDLGSSGRAVKKTNVEEGAAAVPSTDDPEVPVEESSNDVEESSNTIEEASNTIEGSSTTFEESSNTIEESSNNVEDVSENLQSLAIAANKVKKGDAKKSTQENDDLLKNAFFAALKHNSKNLNLPLLTSNFYRLYVVPEAHTKIDLKHTKYKKLSNFLNAMAKENIICVREESKGVDKIVSINYEHPELLNFVAAVKVPNSDLPQPEKEAPLFHSAMTELYLITDETIPFFTKLNFKRGDGISSSQVKKLLKDYISKNQLVYSDPSHKIIKLDECLEQICQKTDLSLESIYQTILMKMNHTYEMRSRNDVAGNKPIIQMTVAQRSGNKKVTLVSNLEPYGIILSEFIKICKQGAAASTTIVKLPSQKSEQLQIQGNQVRFIYNLLTETYKIPPKQIIGLNFAKPIKKSKK